MGPISLYFLLCKAEQYSLVYTYTPHFFIRLCQQTLRLLHALAIMNAAVNMGVQITLRDSDFVGHLFLPLQHL